MTLVFETNCVWLRAWIWKTWNEQKLKYFQKNILEISKFHWNWVKTKFPDFNGKFPPWMGRIDIDVDLSFSNFIIIIIIII